MTKTTNKEDGNMAPKNDTYQRVTDRIIESLEAGVVPWHKPWKNLGGMARNLNSGRAYRGVNVFLTAMTAMAAGYTDNRWATFNGIKKAGGSIRKGEKGTLVILWKPIEKKDKATGEVTDKFLMLKGYTVFNVEQADWPEGVPSDGTETDERAHEENEVAETIISEYTTREGITLTRGGNSAHYSPLTDSVAVPVAEAFESGESFYRATFHELVHSTGHESRLNRLETTTFGSEPYAREELVAELGASMLTAVAGVEDEVAEQSAAYIASWLRELRDDKQLVVKAAAAAQRAADRVLDTKFETTEEPSVAPPVPNTKRSDTEVAIMGGV
jgi:antirestriction protein ArdC